MSETAPVQRPTRAPRWMWIVMVLSLAANLVIVGMVAAAAMHWRTHHGAPGAGFERFARTLPDERRDVLRQLLEEQQGYQGLRKAAWQSRRRARQAFTSEPFDLDKLKQAYADAGAAHEALGKARADWFVRLASVLTAEERRAYLDWRRERRGGWRRHRESEHGD